MLLKLFIVRKNNLTWTSLKTYWYCLKGEASVQITEYLEEYIYAAWNKICASHIGELHN